MNKKTKDKTKREQKNKPALPAGTVTLDDFVAYLPKGNYIFLPTREPWPAKSVNASIPPIALVDASGRPILDDNGEQKFISASVWLDKNCPVQQATWCPGQETLIADKLVSGDAGFIDRPRCTTLNLYRPPTIRLGNAALARPWLEHLHLIYPSDADRIEKIFAHRVQRPGEKTNQMLLLGGDQGIGKDTIIEPLRRAVGSWNVNEISADKLFGTFNPYVKSVVLRISEANDLGGEMTARQFYERMKTYSVTPPETLRCNDKNLREHHIFNVMLPIITTNHKTGMYAPAGDRRIYAVWSEAKQEQFTKDKDFWKKFYQWYDDGGFEHVAAYLAMLDLSGFDPKAPPPKTEWFWELVEASRAPEDSELADALDHFGWPNATTLAKVRSIANGDFAKWLGDRQNRRQIPHRFANVGYVSVRNDADKSDGQWKIGDTRQTIYAKLELSLRDRLDAARKLVKGVTSW
jgi:hypothetical protein